MQGAAARAIQLLDSPAMQPPTRPTMLLRAQAALVLWQGVVATADPQCAGPPSPAPPAAVVVCGARDQALKLLRQSAEALQSWLSIHADPLPGTLAQAEEVQGQRPGVMRAQAEARAAPVTSTRRRSVAGRAGAGAQRWSQRFIEPR
jgi:hypothetical protein